MSSEKSFKNFIPYVPQLPDDIHTQDIFFYAAHKMLKMLQ